MPLLIAACSAFFLPGAVLLLHSAYLTLWAWSQCDLWYSESAAFGGTLLLATGLVGIAASRRRSLWLVAVFAGACAAVVALECGLGVIVLCKWELLDAAAEDFEATGGLLALLDWAEGHSILSGVCASALLLAQVCSFFVTASMAVDLLSDEHEAAGEACEEHWSAAPSLEKEVQSSVLADLSSVHDRTSPRWLDVTLMSAFLYMAAAGLLLLLVSAKLALAPAPAPAPAPANALRGALGAAGGYGMSAGLGFPHLTLPALARAPAGAAAPAAAAPGERTAAQRGGETSGDGSAGAGGDAHAGLGLQHGHHRHRRHHHKQHVPAGGGAPGSDEERAGAWFAGVLGVAGAALLLCGTLAAGGAWWGVAGLLHLAAGAGSVLLAAQAFVLHMYCQHWRLLEVAADFDNSDGLRTALRILDAHPVPLRAAAALLGVGQAICIAAAANYETGMPLAVRAKTAGCWARDKCEVGAAAAAAAAAAARARLARLPARDELLAALSARFSSSGGGSQGSGGSRASEHMGGGSWGSLGGSQRRLGCAAASEAGSDAGSGEESLALDPNPDASSGAPVLYAAFGGTPWAAKPRMLAPSPPGSPAGSAPAHAPVRWAVREGHLPY